MSVFNPIGFKSLLANSLELKIGLVNYISEGKSLRCPMRVKVSVSTSVKILFRKKKSISERNGELELLV